MSARQTSPGGVVKPALEPLDFMEVQEHRAAVSPQVPLKAYLDNRVRAMKMPTAVLSEPEPVFCGARLPHATAPGGFVRCCVDHVETGEVKHGAMLGASFFRWSDEDMRVAANWKCLSCGEPCAPKGKGGCCSWACWNEDAA